MTRSHSTPTGPRVDERPRALVMIVDDEVDLRDSIGELLSAENCDVLCAGDGGDALRQLRGADVLPSLILLDLMMPRMDGWEFRDAQRRDPRLQSIPVVVMTATHNHPLIDVNLILYKPVDPDILLTAVHRFASGPATDMGRDQANHDPTAGFAELDTAVFSDRFVDMLGHDLRNPISALQITGTLLSGRTHDQETVEHAGRILDVVHRMNLTVAQLLDFMRLRRGREIALARTRMNFAELCQRVVGSLARSTGRKIELLASSSMEGSWDRERVELLVSTLVREACDRDRSQAAIVVKAYPSGNTVCLEIEHRGQATERRPFRPPRENEASLSPLEDECMRVGLGMTIARQIVHAHEGEIRVEAGPASTRVTVVLPYSSSC